jgi:hypothetical protein
MTKRPKKHKGGRPRLGEKKLAHGVFVSFTAQDIARIDALRVRSCLRHAHKSFASACSRVSPRSNRKLKHDANRRSNQLQLSISLSFANDTQTINRDKGKKTRLTVKDLDIIDRIVAPLARRNPNRAHHVKHAIVAHADLHDVDPLDALAMLVLSGALRLRAARKYSRSSKGQRAQARYERRRATRRPSHVRLARSEVNA